MRARNSTNRDEVISALREALETDFRLATDRDERAACAALLKWLSTNYSQESK